MLPSLNLSFAFSRHLPLPEMQRRVVTLVRAIGSLSFVEPVCEMDKGVESAEQPGIDSEGDTKGQPNSLDSYSTQQRPFSVSEVSPVTSSSSTTAPPVLRSMPDPASTRSKVFRHKLQKTLKQQVVLSIF